MRDIKVLRNIDVACYFVGLGNLDGEGLLNQNFNGNLDRDGNLLDTLNGVRHLDRYVLEDLIRLRNRDGNLTFNPVHDRDFDRVWNINRYGNLNVLFEGLRNINEHFNRDGDANLNVVRTLYGDSNLIRSRDTTFDASGFSVYNTFDFEGDGVGHSDFVRSFILFPDGDSDLASDVADNGDCNRDSDLNLVRTLDRDSDLVRDVDADFNRIGLRNFNRVGLRNGDLTVLRNRYASDDGNRDINVVGLVNVHINGNRLRNSPLGRDSDGVSDVLDLWNRDINSSSERLRNRDRNLTRDRDGYLTRHRNGNAQLSGNGDFAVNDFLNYFAHLRNVLDELLGALDSTNLDGLTWNSVNNISETITETITVTIAADNTSSTKSINSPDSTKSINTTVATEATRKTIQRWLGARKADHRQDDQKLHLKYTSRRLVDVINPHVPYVSQ